MATVWSQTCLSLSLLHLVGVVSVVAQLDEKVAELTRDGFEEVERYQDQLRDAERHDQTYRLARGATYLVIAVCEACEDLDLEVSIADDVYSNFQTGTDPQVQFDVSRNGSYNISVIMSACSEQPCRFDVAVLRKSATVPDGRATGRGGGRPAPTAAAGAGRSVAEGFEEMDSYQDQLRDAERHRHRIRLQRGTRYKVVASCDACEDLDVEVSFGDHVFSEFGTDISPTVEFEAPGSGRYEIAVIMSECKTQPCRFDVVVLRAVPSGT